MLQYSTVPQYSDIVQHSIVNTFIMYTLQYSTVQPQTSSKNMMKYDEI